MALSMLTACGSSDTTVTQVDTTENVTGIIEAMEATLGLDKGDLAGNEAVETAYATYLIENGNTKNDSAITVDYATYIKDVYNMTTGNGLGTAVVLIEQTDYLDEATVGTLIAKAIADQGLTASSATACTAKVTYEVDSNSGEVTSTTYWCVAVTKA